MGESLKQCGGFPDVDSGCCTVQLLHKLSIRGVNGPEKLLKVIKVRFARVNTAVTDVEISRSFRIL